MRTVLSGSISSSYPSSLLTSSAGTPSSVSVLPPSSTLALSLQERRLNSPLVRSFANLLYLLFPFTHPTFHTPQGYDEVPPRLRSIFRKARLIKPSTTERSRPRFLLPRDCARRHSTPHTRLMPKCLPRRAPCRRPRPHRAGHRSY